MILAAAVWGRNVQNEKFLKLYDKARSSIMTPLTAEDVKNAGKRTVSALAGFPGKVLEAMAQADEASKYSEPIDEVSDLGIIAVHAVAGGKVIRSGKSEELGLYIEIRHENAVSVYGNLDSIKVVERDRVRRGEIIGTYSEDGGKEFYFHLDKDI